MSAFCGDLCTQEQLLSLCNSKLTTHLSRALNPSVSFGIKNFNALPAAVLGASQVQEPVARLVEVAALDWNAYERSWNFASHPLLSGEWLVTSDQQEQLATSH